MPIIVATVLPKPEDRAAVREALLAAAPAVHQEKGCHLYAMHENDEKFVVIESWESLEDMGVHAAGPAFTAMSAALEGKLTAPLDVVVLSALPAGDPAKGALPA
ncbi:putative quinol monooxygenase [Cryptosporangium phraense]|uniref:Antibiotic biosynthesis monooxygenase n=1 Tax=Cryptosporangium phraense TaxID=2593070 RepID=A0A545AMT3_9ACTN|nr:putative quinol monooxygenase [Cryptosporangium phraense]TQS42632.1 antibiotic biosynthesis monooxygenase [Cryptosporangium phraense]